MKVESKTVYRTVSIGTGEGKNSSRCSFTDSIALRRVSSFEGEGCFFAYSTLIPFGYRVAYLVFFIEQYGNDQFFLREFYTVPIGANAVLFFRAA
jgi:hypothetical protein